MHRRLLLSFAILSALAATAYAVPTITVGDVHNLPNSSANQLDVIDVSYDAVTGGGLMQGQTVYISVADEGDGGDEVADAGEPFITAVDALTGTVWAANNAGNPAPAAVAPTNQIWSFDLTTASGTVNATGKVFSVTINRNGAPAGSTWGLRVFLAAADLGGPYSSNWSEGTNIGVAFASGDDADGLQGAAGVPDGAFTYLIPEPSSVVLGLLGAAGLGAVLIRRRRAGA